MGLNWSKYKSDFVKFDEIGTAVEGTILVLEEGSDYNGNTVPQLVIDTPDGSRKVTAGQVMLQAALAEKEPEEGDFIKIEYHANGEGKPGRAPAKLFRVEVKRAQAVSKDDLA